MLAAAALAALAMAAFLAVRTADAGPTAKVLHISSAVPADSASAPDHKQLDVGSDANGDITVEAWVYLNAGSTRRAILGKESASGTDSSFSMSVNSTGNLVCAFTRLNGGMSTGQSSAPLPQGKWLHLACMFDYSENDPQVIVAVGQGSSATVTYDSALVAMGKVLNSTAPLEVGKCYRTIGCTVPFDGKIDEIRISNVVRYPSSYTPPGKFACDANTRALWHFPPSETATVFRDSCGFNNKLTASGGAHPGPAN
jgi:hypothetical protein